jgi:hypothetical protein
VRGVSPRPDLGWWLGIGFLAIQILWVLAAQLRESRHFSWAPHTVQVRYGITVVEAGRLLPPHEVQARYGVPAAGWEAHSHRNLMELVEQAERTRVAPESAVRLEYWINERGPFTWRWP